MRSRFLDLKQRQLDATLSRWREALANGPAAPAAARPPSGWLKAIREALGMPATHLAKRLGVVPSSITRLETSEADDTVSLATLRRAAEALGCELHYVLVPKQSIAETLDQRAEQIARERVGKVAHSMALEAQSTTADAIEREVAELKADLLRGSRRELWR